MPNPKCFIGYSWDSTPHKDWVRSLAEQLQKIGVHTYLDQWDASLGDQLSKFMETSIRESNFVLLICTNNFAFKANAGQGGVGTKRTLLQVKYLVNQHLTQNS
jgi:TIR domain